MPEPNAISGLGGGAGPLKEGKEWEAQGGGGGGRAGQMAAGFIGEVVVCSDTCTIELLVPNFTPRAPPSPSTFPLV